MSQRFPPLLAAAALLLACGDPAPQAPTAAALSSAGDSTAPFEKCENVTVTGKVIRVTPTDADDTANVQCALDLARGRYGAVVQLARGTFFVRPVFADYLHGEIAGAGMDATVVRNPKEPFAVPPDFVFTQDPSRDFAWPYLLTVTGGSLKVRDLTLAAVGWPVTSDWGTPSGVQSLAGGAVVQGQVDAEFERVKVVGQRTSDDAFAGYNLYNGIYFEGPTTPRASGSFRVHDCVFRGMASWAEVGFVEDSRIELTGNDARDMLFGGDWADMTRSTMLVTRNVIRADMGVNVYEFPGGALDASKFSLIANDLALGGPIDVAATFTNGTTCSILANRIVAPEPAIHLGPATSHCLVAGNHGATVLDEGQGNRVVP
jgi:hypothetical protein